MGGFGIGLYNAFSAECRTKHYTNTKSYDITSDCPYQPCFLHVRQKEAPCLNMKYCMGNQNEKLHNQIVDILFRNPCF